MKTIYVPCEDGSDPDCHGSVPNLVPDDFPDNPSPEEIDKGVDNGIIESTVCPACGSDQYRNSEGEIIPG